MGRANTINHKIAKANMIETGPPTYLTTRSYLDDKPTNTQEIVVRHVISTAPLFVRQAKSIEKGTILWVGYKKYQSACDVQKKSNQ